MRLTLSSGSVGKRSQGTDALSPSTPSTVTVTEEEEETVRREEETVREGEENEGGRN